MLVCRSALESGSEPVEGSRVRELVKGLLDRQGAVAGTGGGGVALDVVAAVGVDLPELGGCLPGLPVAARFLPPCQFLFRAADTHEDDVESVEHGEAVQQALPLAEDVVDDEVVADLCHAGDRAVEAARVRVRTAASSSGPSSSVRSRAHAVDRVDGHVEEGTVQDQQELPGDARLA